jgi:hypothetical protein
MRIRLMNPHAQSKAPCALTRAPASGSSPGIIPSELAPQHSAGFTLDLSRVIKLATAVFHQLEDAARQPAEDQRRHDHVRAHHNAHLFLDGSPGSPPGFVDQPFHIRFAKATFLGALAAVRVYLIPPRAPVIVAKRLPHQLAHGAALPLGNGLGPLQHLRRQGYGQRASVSHSKYCKVTGRTNAPHPLQ